jgi:Family of unknown function (DUF6464)
MDHIGNQNCKHNAHSPYLRCVINPYGPCEGCPSYAQASLGERLLYPVWAIDPNNTEIAQDKALRFLMVAFVGVQFGVLLFGLILVPILNRVIVKTHPCWPVIGVTQYCEE